LDCLVASPPVRRFLEVAFAARSRWHLVRLDRVAPARAQRRALLGLVDRARGTLFGREHDFRRIRSEADFRRLVPLRTPAELWREYSEPSDTWPGEHSANGAYFLAAPHPALRDILRPVVLSGELLAGYRRAIQTALSLVLRVRPHSRLLAGSLVWLGDDTILSDSNGDAVSANGSIGARFPGLLRHAVRAGLDGNCLDHRRLDACLPAMARRVAHESPSCLVGPAERIAGLLEQVGALRGGNAWPDLTAVIYSRRDRAFDAEAIRQRLSKSVVLLEMLDRPEGPVAIEDPRFGRLRLLPDHGVYFELVPVGEPSLGQPARLGLDEASVGMTYELAVSSPAGVWACRSGLHVCFDQLSPPLLRVVAAPAAAAQASGSSAQRVGTPNSPTLPTIRTDGPAVTPVRPGHRQTGSSPAAPPESSVRSPWSVPVDRG
jgi:hypothetical protein